jgi:methionyl aminopeptidase
LETTKECLEKGIAAVKNGKRIGDISHVIEEHAASRGYSVVKDLFGHGVGKQLHEDPLIPNFGKQGEGPKIEAGMTFAIEPMLNIGKSDIETLDDGWTVVTADGSLSAHFEHTVLVKKDSVEVLTW